MRKCGGSLATRKFVNILIRRTWYIYVITNSRVGGWVLIHSHIQHFVQLLNAIRYVV